MSVFEDLRTLTYEGRAWAVLDSVRMEGRDYLGLVARTDIEAAAEGLAAGRPTRFPPAYLWVEELGEGHQAVEAGFERRLEAFKRARAVEIFRGNP